MLIDAAKEAAWNLVGIAGIVYLMRDMHSSVARFLAAYSVVFLVLLASHYYEPEIKRLAEEAHSQIDIEEGVLK